MSRIASCIRPAEPADPQRQPRAKPELLAPAGDRDAAWAALQYGADAIYVGLNRFSARADATNLTPEDLRAVVAYAHAMPQRRRVYAAVNTLVQECELDRLVETLEELDDCGVDAVILQDLGVYRLARRAFPRLRLHASTQLAVHNLAGVQALAALGFSRVVLARELPLDEVAAISRAAAIETEIFVHGALCYAYSGLCLFSSHQSGRSGNRGRCAYCCREPFAAAGPDGQRAGHAAGFPFSMRDLALAPQCAALAGSGVASLKIEGRMKQALYVACVTDFYRRKLDGRLDAAGEAARIEDLQTIFSRPWTQLYAAGRTAPAATIIDPRFVGHRGAPIGEVQAVVRDAHGDRWLRFQTRRAIEKHDGIQLELPPGGKPFGFAVAGLRRTGSSRSEIAVPAQTAVEVQLPAEVLPEIPAGSTVFCSASQAVRRQFPLIRPRAAEQRWARPVRVQVALRADGFTLSAQATGENPAMDGAPAVSARVDRALALVPAKQPERTDETVRRALARSGDTPWQATACTLSDPQGLFLPASALNDARRSLFDALTASCADARRARRASAQRACGCARSQPRGAELWTAKLALADPVVAALAGADEIVLQVGHGSPEDARRHLETWLQHTPRERLRIALPLITRQHEAGGLQATLAALLADGWTRWECADLAGAWLLRQAAGGVLDVTADWTCQGLNHLARDQWRDLGMARATASPEDTAENLTALAACDGPAMEVILWQHTPLFVSETPPVAGDADAGPPWRFVNRRGGQVVTHRVDNRWVTVLAEPFCLAGHLATLRRAGVRCFRLDFAWSPPDAARPAACWDDLRAGRTPAAFHVGNFERGFA